MPDILEFPAWRITEMIKSQEVSAEEYIFRIGERIDKIDGEVNAFITKTLDSAVEKAKQIDSSINRGEKVGRLAGVALAVKDNICTRNIRTTCGSKMLESFIPPYNATVVELLENDGAIVVGKTNMDEFGMGSSTEQSYFGATSNPIDENLVAGGSSGGSAASVAAGETTVALGADTGGSIRCPAAFCGVVGLKPTYGLVSRYGLISYANSLEQIGPITRDVLDNALLLSIISGKDSLDSTSVGGNDDYQSHVSSFSKHLKIGIPKELLEGADKSVVRIFWNSLEKLESEGAEYDEISLKNLDYALAAYYVIAMSEASSNLARFDGVRYGFRVQDGSRDWSSVFSKDRREAFGYEVKRRIILGTYALSAGYYDEYYLKAQRVKTLIRNDLEVAFKKFDVLASPTMPMLPFKKGEKLNDPLKMYLSDIDTVPANLAGIPAISVPVGSSKGLPVGFQILGPPFGEKRLFQAAYMLENLVSRRKEVD